MQPNASKTNESAHREGRGKPTRKSGGAASSRDATKVSASESGSLPQEPNAQNPKGRKQVDWESVRREWDAGMLSVVAIAQMHQVSDAAVHKHARLNAWPARPPKAWVQARVEEALQAREAGKGKAGDGDEAAGTGGEQEQLGNSCSTAVEREGGEDGGEAPRWPSAPVREPTAAEVVAARGVQVVERHRKEIKELRGSLGQIQRNLALMLQGKPAKVPFVGDKESVSDVAFKLAKSLSLLVPLERTAFNLGKDEAKQGGEQIVVNIQLDTSK